MPPFCPHDAIPPHMCSAVRVIFARWTSRLFLGILQVHWSQRRRALRLRVRAYEARSPLFFTCCCCGRSRVGRECRDMLRCWRRSQHPFSCALSRKHVLFRSGPNRFVPSVLSRMWIEVHTLLGPGDAARIKRPFDGDTAWMHFSAP